MALTACLPALVSNPNVHRQITLAGILTECSGIVSSPSFTSMYSPDRSLASVDVVSRTRTCMVSFVDSDGIRHSVEVAAESLYKAAALAGKEFRRHTWMDDLGPGALTKLTVRNKTPSATREVSIRQLEEWTARTSKSPHNALLKSRVRELLSARVNSG